MSTAVTVSRIEGDQAEPESRRRPAPEADPPRIWWRLEEINPEAPPPLLLVGTVHDDPQGCARVRRLLHHLRPRTVTVEISPFSLRYRERHGPRWQERFRRGLAGLPEQATEHLAIRRLAMKIALPYEWQAAAAYGRSWGVPVLAVDLSAPARRHLPAYERELLSPRNLKALITLPDGSLTEWVRGEFRRARLSVRRPLLLPGGRGQGELTRREAHLARRLTQLWRPGLPLVHLGGWEHLAPREPGPNLFDRLADLNPARLLLEEADCLPPLPGENAPWV